jgi:chromosome segregation ATPase
MSQIVSKTTTPVSQIREQQTRLQKQVRTLERQHNRLMESLNTRQRSQMGNPIREMEQTRNHIQAQLQAMNQTTQQPNPNREQIARQARKMEQWMVQWQDQYHGLSGVLGMEP